MAPLFDQAKVCANHLAQLGFAQAVATLGTACTPTHVQKLLRQTDTVIFSFDGDKAGRRAAARALEASLPHATDLRSVKFLFLPSEHDPDSYVRELGPAAFEQQVAQAVPLSRQLIEQASEEADLSSAEGRARMLAQAKPLWMALPDGALKRQLLPELARQAQLEAADLASLWGQAAAARGARADGVANGNGNGPGPLRLLRRGAIRVRPAGPADIAVRLLLQHADWWDRLSPDDQQLLHDIRGTHGEIVRWLEGQLMEHGAMTWSALNDAIEDQAWAEEARSWVRGGLGDEGYGLDELQQALGMLMQELLKQEADAIIAASPGPDELLRYREILEQIKLIKTARGSKPA